MWNDICYLGSLEIIENEIGDRIKAIVYGQETYCNEKSVKFNEFYQAQALGFKPEIVLELMRVDYNKEKFVEYEGEEYRVLRTYKTSGEKIELTLVRGVNDGDS